MRWQKGMLKVIIKVSGTACHSGYPELGDNALWKLIDVLNDLKKENWPSDADLGATTMNVGIVQGMFPFPFLHRKNCASHTLSKSWTSSEYCSR